MHLADNDEGIIFYNEKITSYEKRLEFIDTVSISEMINLLNKFSMAAGKNGINEISDVPPF